MKPLFLEFSGLNSYRECQKIDFVSLSSCGLFGIFGSTGAGKSTILDAMTLALFGKVNRAPRATQGIINSREKQCTVSFRFQLNSHNYLVERVYERTKGEPFSSKFKAGRLVEDESKVLADRSDLITKEVVSLLGMDHDRFCQTVILPQGKFDQLLKLSPAERSSMLEELFHYQQYGEGLVSKVREKLKNSEQQVFSLTEQLNLLGSCSEQDIENAQKYVVSLEEEHDRVSALYQTAVLALSEANSQLQKVEQAAEHSRMLALLKKEEPAMMRLRSELSLAEKAEMLRSLIDDAVAANEDYKASEKECFAAENAYRIAFEKADTLKNELCFLENKVQAERSNAEKEIENLYPAVVIAKQIMQREIELGELKRNNALDVLAANLSKTAHAAEECERQHEKALTQYEDALSIERERFALWQESEIESEQLRLRDAASYLRVKTQHGDKCPVCGHLVESFTDCYAVDYNIAEVLEKTEKLRSEWKAAKYRCDELRTLTDQAKSRLTEVLNLSASAQKAYSDTKEKLDACESSLSAEREKLFAICASGKPEEEIRKLKEQLSEYDEQITGLQARITEAASASVSAEIHFASAKNSYNILRQRLEKVIAESRRRAAECGFPDVNSVKKALMTEGERDKLREKLREYDDAVLVHTKALENQSTFDEQSARNHLKESEEKAHTLQQSRDQLILDLGRAKADLERTEKNHVLAEEIRRNLKKNEAELTVYRRLADLLKGNSFVRYLAHGTMLDLCHDASFILRGLTNDRYRLELIEDGKSSDFIMADDHQGGLLRQVTGLSGGETFLVSLALSLALSQKIQMNGTELGFFFLDEGFGALDESALDAAMNVLERLPSDRRTVGIITHVAAVKDRVPCYLEVTSDSVLGSRVCQKMN